MSKIFPFVVIIIAFFCISSLATIINVPDDYPTIQEGIDASVDGDTVLVADGLYTGVGNYDITTSGKAIVVMSERGAVNTIIDGEGSHNGFNISALEDSNTVIMGFTITNVLTGIFCDLSQPVIRSNIFNDFANYGIHINGNSGDTLIRVIIEDCIMSQVDTSGQIMGTGIFVYRAAEVRISGCKFSDCSCGMNFYALNNEIPLFQVTNCVIRDSESRGIWTHS